MGSPRRGRRETDVTDLEARVAEIRALIAAATPVPKGMRHENAALRAQVKTLRDLLKPFARAANDWDGVEAMEIVTHYRRGLVRVQDLRRARQVLENP